jgi:hypothetical protein
VNSTLTTADDAKAAALALLSGLPAAMLPSADQYCGLNAEQPASIQRAVVQVGRWRVSLLAVTRPTTSDPTETLMTLATKKASAKGSDGPQHVPASCSSSEQLLRDDSVLWRAHCSEPGHAGAKETGASAAITPCAGGRAVSDSHAVWVVEAVEEETGQALCDGALSPGEPGRPRLSLMAARAMPPCPQPALPACALPEHGAGSTLLSSLEQQPTSPGDHGCFYEVHVQAYLSGMARAAVSVGTSVHVSECKRPASPAVAAANADRSSSQKQSPETAWSSERDDFTVLGWDEESGICSAHALPKSGVHSLKGTARPGAELQLERKGFMPRFYLAARTQVGLASVMLLTGNGPSRVLQVSPPKIYPAKLPPSDG